MTRLSRLVCLVLVFAGFGFLSPSRAEACSKCVSPTQYSCTYSLFFLCKPGVVGCTDRDCVNLAPGPRVATRGDKACAAKVAQESVPKPSLKVVRAEKLPART